MNVEVHHRHLEITQNLQRLIERQSRKIQKLLPTFASRDLDLNITLEKLPRGKQYHAVLLLTLPQSRIRVEELESNATTSVLRSFEELLRRVKKFKSQLNRERFWQRHPEPVRTAVPETARELEAVINQNLDKIENYIRRELYHQASINSLPAGLLQPQALLDEVFLRVSEESASRPENIPLEQWMFQMARRVVRQRMEALQAARDEPHIEETVPATSRWEDEQLDFYQPDEVLRLEDLMSDDRSDSPEELLEQEEAQESLQHAIARLPESLRESFVLFALEGFNSDEIAMITGKNPSKVLDEVEQARTRLRQQIQT